MGDIMNISLKNKLSRTILEKFLKKKFGTNVRVDEASAYLDDAEIMHIKANVQIDIPYAKLTSAIMKQL